MPCKTNTTQSLQSSKKRWVKFSPTIRWSIPTMRTSKPSLQIVEKLSNSSMEKLSPFFRRRNVSSVRRSSMVESRCPSSLIVVAFLIGCRLQFSGGPAVWLMNVNSFVRRTPSVIRLERPWATSLAWTCSTRSLVIRPLRSMSSMVSTPTATNAVKLRSTILPSWRKRIVSLFVPIGTILPSANLSVKALCNSRAFIFPTRTKTINNN